jgi:hypothetical protein
MAEQRDATALGVAELRISLTDGTRLAAVAPVELDLDTAGSAEASGPRSDLLPRRNDDMEARYDRSSEHALRDQGRGRQAYGPRTQQPGWFDRPQYDETRPFFWTSEFLALVLLVTGVAICAAVFDNLDVWRGLLLITGVTGAYILSRGIAKAGSHSPSIDPRNLIASGTADGDNL